MASKTNTNQKHLETLPKNRLVRIYPNDTNAPPVIAHLPESYGFGVGAEIIAPFSSFISDGNIANIMRMAKISNKQGLLTTKTFIGPDQPDIPVELKFDTYYDAFNDVFVPVYNLLSLASGKIGQALEKEQVREASESLGFVDAAAGVVSEYTLDAILDYATIKYLSSPPLVNVAFGNVFQLSECYISSVEPRWSHVLDSSGFPMEATVSMTFVLANPMTAEDIQKAMSIGGKSIAVRP